MAVVHLSDGTTDGTVLGQDTSDKISFYGITPVVQQAVAAAAATTVAVSTTTGSITSWGFAGSTQANAIVTLVNSLRTELIEVGIVKAT